MKKSEAQHLFVYEMRNIIPDLILYPLLAQKLVKKIYKYYIISCLWSHLKTFALF